MNGFADAPMKGEGIVTDYGFSEGYIPKPPKVETTYVERRVPVDLEDEAHKLIDDWLKLKGFDPEVI